MELIARRRVITNRLKIHVRNQTSGETLGDRVEPARSSRERRRGLLGRTGLAAGEGLWIDSCEAVHSFGMKFPIDVLHLNRAKTVTKVRSGMKPWRISVSLRGRSVLELPAGTAARTRTGRGDRLVFTQSALLAVAAALCFISCTKRQVAANAPVASANRQIRNAQIRNAIDAGDGDYQLTRLREKLIAAPSDLTVRLDLAAAYEAKGYRELALDHYRLACAQHPDAPESALRLARTLIASGRPAKGISAYRDFLAQHTGVPPLYLAWLGILEDDRGDWKAGEVAHRAALKRALALHQDRDYLHNNLGFCQLHQGSNAEAAEEFRAALRLNPTSEVARDNLAASLTAYPAEALVHFQSVEGPAAAHNNLAVLLIERGKYPEAHQELRRALNFDRAYGPALRNLKTLSEIEGKPAILAVSPAPQSPLSRVKLARVKLAWSNFFRSKPTAAPHSNRNETIQTAARTEESPQ